MCATMYIIEVVKAMFLAEYGLVLLADNYFV